MEVDGNIVDSITHAVRAVTRRQEGLQALGDRHSAACRRSLRDFCEAAVAYGAADRFQ